MLLNYLLIALFNFKRQPVFSAIKVLSLAIGLGCSILVIMHVQYSLSFDRHFPNAENIYRLVTGLTTDHRIEFDGSSDANAPKMKLDYPDIVHIARIQSSRGYFGRGDSPALNDYYWSEPEFIKILSLKFTKGDPDTALNEPNSVVLGEAAAAKYFPGEDPLGKTLTLDSQTELRVTGVMLDLPPNSHIKLPILVSASTGRKLFGQFFMDSPAWVGFSGTQTYLMLPNKAEAARISADLPKFLERNIPAQQRTFAANNKLTLTLQPLLDIYLDERAGFGTTNNRPKILLGLGIFAVLILLTSCINFANLSLAQVQQRFKEIGVRKTLGAKRSQIVWQFLFESLLLTVLALLLAIPAIYFALPVYTNLTDTDFTFASALKAGGIWALPLFVLATGALSGLLPALALSRLEPASIIKGVGVRNRFSGWLRSTVTVVQFGFSTGLILLALAIGLQIRHLSTMDLGFDKNDLIVMDSTYNPRAPKEFDYTAMINDLRQHPGIVSVARSGAMPPNTGSYNPWRLPSFGPDEFRPVSHNVVDVGYFDTMKFKLLAGRWFADDHPNDFIRTTPPPPGEQPAPEPEHSIVITRYAVSNFGFASPDAALNQVFTPGGVGGPSYRVIGVIEDFRQSGGLEDVLRSTSILRATQDPMRVLLVRIDPKQADSALKHIDEVWKRHRPDVAPTRTFFDQTFNDLIYKQTNGISKAATFASIITVIISAMGLYALAFYSTERRTKEVGIRKVMGATSGKIVYLLTWDFLKPVLLACALASVAGYFVIRQFMTQFSSQASVPLWWYLLVALGTALVAVLTVSVQCFRAANADPVKSLRYE
ncbi:MAG TPA: FtsX-like permease family protein [Candidatus Acidoferrum sp.]|nr:FtsX-like permease family protein [Candidatus Acidoferrum sp.]